MMLNKQFIYPLALVICGSFISNTFAQTQWTKYEHNPVHLYGGQPSVILNNDTLKMWYARGVEDSLGLKIVICYATSPNGIEWQKYHGNPVMTTYAPTYDSDSGGPWAPSILFIDNEYRMWYESGSGISLATAPITGIEQKADLRTRFSHKIEITICPNPFSQSTEISYSIPDPRSLIREKSSIEHPTSRIQLRIYDLAGRLIKFFPITNHSTGSDGQSPQASRTTITICWDGRDDNGKRPESGVYFCQLKTNNFNSSKKLILLN